MKRSPFGPLVLAAALVPAALGVSGQNSPPEAKIERLKHQIQRIIYKEDGQVGVAVKHVETGQSLSLNGEERFPMASTFKVPVLLELLYQAQEGRFKLEDEIDVQKNDQHLGSGLLSQMVMPGLKLSVLNAAHLMMMISDNSATDLLLAKVGPENVNARLKALGITGLSVDRSCQALISDLSALMKGSGRAADKAAYVKFGQDPRDQAAPAAMAAILEKVFKREVLTPEYCDLMLRILFKCETGPGRLKGLLPAGTPVAHKTGTIAGTVNDVGVITLPDNQGHVVIAVLTKEFTDETAHVEDLIARIARVVYDYFLFAN